MGTQPPAPPRALTVLLAPPKHTEEILAVLADYSAVGLLHPFAWVAAEDVGGPSTPATMIQDGQARPVVLQQLLTGERYDRIRITVLVPIEAPSAERVPLETEQAVEQSVRSSAMGSPISLLRLLITPGNSAPTTPDLALVLEGWHNLLIAPEDSAAPGLGAVPWNRLTDPADVAQQTAPVVAGISGLWAGLDRSPFDALEILPGQTVRAVRAFYRRLDSTAVEESLRTHLFDPTGRLPLPQGGQVPVVYIEDVPTATQSMARALWTKHRDVLRGPRLAVDAGPTQTISIWAAMKMFLKFMATALRRAPSAWLSAVMGSVTSAVASTVQGTVFGRTDSAFAVVADATKADWQDLNRSAETLQTALNGGQDGLVQQQDLTGLWTDFANGALTLADGGRRAAGLDPIAVGSAVGVVFNAEDVVPSPAGHFRGIPTSLAAVIGVGEVEGADVLGAANVRERLQNAYSDPAAGVEARNTGTELDRWQAAATRSYAWQVSSVLADFMQRARSEVTDMVSQIQAIANRDAVDERLRERQAVISIILRTLTVAVFVVLLALIGIAAADWVSWKFALSTGAAVILIYILVSLALFLLSQRDLFAEMNLRKSQQHQLEMMHANLRTAVQDLSRMTSAYGQLLAWCRTLGTVLRAPFGPPPPSQRAAGFLVDGLPRSTQVGIATPSPDQADNAVHGIQRRLYSLGWLTKPWEDMLAEAAARLREEPIALFRQPGVGTSSGLDQWSAAVMSGRVRPTGADALWARVEQMFTDEAAGRPGALSDALTGTVRVPTIGRDIPAQQFNAGFVDHRPDRAAPFDSSLFTNAAVTAGRSGVAIDEAVVVRGGLGYRAVVVQASDGLPPYNFALFEIPVAIAGGDDDPTTMVRRTELDVPPGEDMVF
ncbi:hypothetical protein [Mycobacterium sp. DL99]|uniref:hypothetical protein n=1 Tax=Mycobacterium sp. DL99 TaxID=2528957 RepID=UPI001080F2FF|nr:hypothetical protein [Mycobacterium sp. DL99]